MWGYFPGSRRAGWGFLFGDFLVWIGTPMGTRDRYKPAGIVVPFTIHHKSLTFVVVYRAASAMDCYLPLVVACKIDNR
jgi:hypothetical protein